MSIKPFRPIVNRNHPLAKGLIACYPFFERGGTTLRDISGKNNNGTLTNMYPATDWIRTPRGYGLDFDGANDYVSIPATVNGLPIGNADRTVTAWVKVTDYTNYRAFVYYGESLNTKEFILYILITSGYLAFSSNNNDLSSSTPVPTGNCNYVAVTISGGNAVVLYLNGVAIQSGTLGSPVNTTATAVNLGRRTSGDLYHKGALDEVRIYNRALTPKEIAQDYADPFSLYRFPKQRLGKSIIIPPAGGSFLQISKYW